MQILDWDDLTPAARALALARPAAALAARTLEQVRGDHRGGARRRRRGPGALRAGNSTASRRRRSRSTTRNSRPRARSSSRADRVPSSARSPTSRPFTAPQLGAPLQLEIEPGVHCERLPRAIGAVGLYVPAGSAPLPSTVIMLAVPARLAAMPDSRAVHAPAARRARQCGGAGGGTAVRRAPGLQARRRAGDRGDGLRHAERAEGRQDVRTRQCLGHGCQAAVRRRPGRRRAATCPPARPRCA